MRLWTLVALMMLSAPAHAGDPFDGFVPFEGRWRNTVCALSAIRISLTEDRYSVLRFCGKTSFSSRAVPILPSRTA